MIEEISAAGLLDVVRALIHNVCTKVPDRAEYRSKISQVGTLSYGVHVICAKTLFSVHVPR